MKLLKVPLPLGILAALAIASMALVYYVSVMPKFIWASTDNASTILVAPGSTVTLLVAGTSATVTLNDSSTKIYYIIPSSIPIPVVYSLKPPSANIATSRGPIVVISNASGVYLKYQLTSGFVYYLKQVAPNVWAPDFTGNYCAVDPTNCGTQIIRVTASTPSTTIGITFVTRSGATYTINSGYQTLSSPATLSLSNERISETMYVFWGGIVVLTPSVPVTITITP